VSRIITLETLIDVDKDMLNYDLIGFFKEELQVCLLQENRKRERDFLLDLERHVSYWTVD
jgi:hypothetical protein